MYTLDVTDCIPGEPDPNTTYHLLGDEPRASLFAKLGAATLASRRSG